jgi:SAM-dependent methyltransferase
VTIAAIPTKLAPLPGKPTVDNLPELQAFAARIATEGAWRPDVAGVVAGFFDGLAAKWNDHYSVRRFDPVADALQRGGVGAGGTCLEVGSGTGQLTPLLAAHFGTVVSIDLSAAMLAQAAGSPGTRLRCDAARLPFAGAVFDAAVLVDTFCFAAELARVLTPDGVVVWVNLLGQDGPLYVGAADIAQVLPGDWGGAESTAGWGTWAVLQRSPARAHSQDRRNTDP